MSNFKYYTTHWTLYLIVLSGIFFVHQTSASNTELTNKIRSEYIVFADVENFSRNHGLPSVQLEQNNIASGIDFFYTADYKKYRLLAEFYAGNEDNEHSHFERLQIGFKFTNNTNLWLGRYHNPIGFWNTQFHHGKYLETTATRPSIIKFEEDGGAIPMHISGLLYEKSTSLGYANLHLSFGIGAGPTLTAGKLHSMDLIKFDTEGHNTGATLHLAYSPVTDEATQFGGSISYFRISDTSSPGSDIHQTIYNAYGVYASGVIKIIGSAYNINNRIENSSENNSSFIYLQTEYLRNQSITLYGRIEASKNADNDAYLVILNSLARNKTIAGIRLEVSRNQFLKFEFSNIHLFSDKYKQFHLQWSAAFL